MKPLVRLATLLAGTALAWAAHAQPSPTSSQLLTDQFLPPSANTAGTASSRGIGKFSAEAWRRAPLASPNWSREKMVRQFFDSFKAPNQQAFEIEGAPTTLDRARVRSLLGEPGYAGEDYDPYGRLRSASDEYRLSARNDHAYQITYNSDHKVTGGFISPEGCKHRLSSFADAPKIPADILGKIAMEKKPAQSGPIADQDTRTVAQVEASVGKPGKHLSSSYVAGGQAWVGYAVWWRLADGSHRYLTVSGHVARREWKEDRFGDETIDGYSVITLLPDCLAH